MPVEMQQMMVNFFYTVLSNSLSKDFQIVNQSGPDTIVLHVAITEARKGRAVINFATTIIPWGIVISAGKQVITGGGVGVGGVSVEAEATDGQTGQILAMGVDQRLGTKALRTKFNGTWGDA